MPRPTPAALVRLLCALALAGPIAAPARAQRRPPRPAADASAAPLGARIDSILDRPAFENGFWGALVEDAATGRVLYARHAGKSFVPASNAKLYTTATALDAFGADYRFTTHLYADGEMNGATLRGDLVVRGSGDPTFGKRHENGRVVEGADPLVVFRAWADSLRALGVRRIEGRIVGDDNLFDDVPLGNGWTWDDEPYYYSAELSALSFNDNTVDVLIEGTRPGEPARVSWTPASTDYVTVVNRTLTLGAGSPVKEGYARARGGNTLTLTTTLGADKRDPESLTVSNPTRYFAHVLRETLVRAGIEVTGEAADADEVGMTPDYAAMRPVASHTSPPMGEVVAAVNKPSNNLYAELLLKLVGTRAGGPAPTEDAPMGSHARGLAISRAFYARAGLDTLRLQLLDGSGLARADLVTPEMTVALLRYMRAHPSPAVRAAYVSSLPIGGVDGSLRNRLREGRARGNVRAKTGSLGNVSSLAGYVTTRSGRVLAFSLMANHFTEASSAARAAQDAVVEALAGME